MSDLKYALRQLVVHRGSSFVVIAMLALGTGATTAIYSLFYQIVLQPLPVAEPERLVNLAAPGPRIGQNTCSRAGTCEETFSYPMFRDLEARQSVFSGLAAQRDFLADLVVDERTSAANGLMVSGRYFEVLGLEPALGRFIGIQDEPGIGESRVVVLSHDYWQNAFGGDRRIVGRLLRVNGQELTIVGVAPEGFDGTVLALRPAVFVPITLRWLMEPQRAADHENRRSAWAYLFARLAAGVDRGEAEAGIDTLHSGIVNEIELSALPSDTPPDLVAQFRARRVMLEPGATGQSQLPDTAATPLAMLLGVTGLVLLIVCVNIANLLLARGTSRSGELAIRASVGATRARLAQQLLAELATLATLGTLLSLPVALFTLRSLVALIPTDPPAAPATLNTAALSFAVATSLGTLLLFGLAPVLQATRTSPGTVMKSNAAQAVGRRGVLRFHGVLATTQIALSTVLLVLAGLFAQSLSNIARVSLGFDVDSSVKFTVTPRRSGYSAARALVFYDDLERRLAAEPGVTSVAAARIALLTGRQSGTLPRFPSADASGTPYRALSNEVSPGFLSTLSIPLLAGRDFTAADRADAPRVAIVNEAFVRRFDLGSDALGKRFELERQVSGTEISGIEIVGVMADAKYDSVRDETAPQLLLPYRQNDNLDALTFYVRGALAPDALLRMVPRVVASIDADLPVTNLLTFKREARNGVFLERMLTTLSASLAGLATLIAAIGLYGVLAYNVSRRTRELGLRLAMGARPVDLTAMVLNQVGVMAAVGGAIGLAAAFGAGRAAQALLYGVSGSDVTVFAAAAGVLLLVVLVAGYLPARRAARTEPMEALRHE
jgi:putative ABC transport system permease protein